jgi:hypothetical protein
MLDGLGGNNSDSVLYHTLLSSRAKINASKSFKEVFGEARQKLGDALNPGYYLLFSVVGQKAIFKCLLERIDNSSKHGATAETLLKTAEEFIATVNGVLAKFDENGFYLFGKEDVSVEMGEDNPLDNFGSIFSSFWEGILYEDKRIVYNSQGVRAFADVLNFAINAVEGTATVIDKIRFSEQRTKRLLKKRFTREEDDYDKLAETIMVNKKQFLIDKISSFPDNGTDGVAQDAAAPEE